MARECSAAAHLLQEREKECVSVYVYVLVREIERWRESAFASGRSRPRSVPACPKGCTSHVCEALRFPVQGLGFRVDGLPFRVACKHGDAL